MGLLSKLTGKVTPQKKPTDDALLQSGAQSNDHDR